MVVYLLFTEYASGSIEFNSVFSTEELAFNMVDKFEHKFKSVVYMYRVDHGTMEKISHRST